jgi:hypothetical protein
MDQDNMGTDAVEQEKIRLAECLGDKYASRFLFCTNSEHRDRSTVDAFCRR